VALSNLLLKKPAKKCEWKWEEWVGVAKQGQKYRTAAVNTAVIGNE